MIVELVGEETGGSEITSYVIQWDAGDINNGFSALVGEASPSLAMDHTVYDNVISGGQYSFSYFAVNIHGAGEASDIQVIQAANNPSRMEAPLITLQSGLLYRVTFVEPNSGGVGIEITEYEVVFK